MQFDSLSTPSRDRAFAARISTRLATTKYLNYMLGADNRMPSRYLDAETGAPSIAPS